MYYLYLRWYLLRNLSPKVTSYTLWASSSNYITFKHSVSALQFSCYTFLVFSILYHGQVKKGKYCITYEIWYLENRILKPGLSVINIPISQHFFFPLHIDCVARPNNPKMFSFHYLIFQRKTGKWRSEHQSMPLVKHWWLSLKKMHTYLQPCVCNYSMFQIKAYVIGKCIYFNTKLKSYYFVIKIFTDIARKCWVLLKHTKIVMPFQKSKDHPLPTSILSHKILQVTWHSAPMYFKNTKARIIGWLKEQR